MKNLALVLAALVAACGGADDDGAITIVDGPIPPDAPIDAPLPVDAPGIDGPGVCTDLDNTAGIVFEQLVGENIPAPEGGDIAPGVYHLTRQTFYTGPGGGSGPSGSAAQSTLRVGASAAGSMEAFIIADDFLNVWSGSVATESTLLFTTFLCPPMAAQADPYTATDTELKIYGPDGNRGLELVFTLTSSSR
jgi:hypothetical protein